MSGSILLVIALGYGFAALPIPRGEGEPGPGALPMALSLALVALATWIVATGVREGVLRRARSADGDDASIEGSDPRRVRRAWGAAFATLVYVALFEPLGFAIATLLYAAVLSWLFDRGRRVLLGVSLGITAGLFVFFQVILGVRLPPGPFG